MTDYKIQLEQVNKALASKEANIKELANKLNEIRSEFAYIQTKKVELEKIISISEKLEKLDVPVKPAAKPSPEVKAK